MQRMRSVRRGAILLALVLLAPMAQASDLPGFGTTVPPKVMIIFDNSYSMSTAPDDQFGVTFDDDYDPDNNPGGSCQNKFCMGKRTMSQTLPAYASLAKMGLASYYQFLQTTYIPSGGGTTQCVYDVLAAPGEVITFKSSTDNGASYSCSPTNCTDPARTCTKTASTLLGFQQIWYSNIKGSSVGSSSYIDTTVTPNRTYTLRSINQQPPRAPYNRYEIASPCPTPQTVGASYSENSLWGCSASNPCTMTYRANRVAGSTLTQTWYQDQGASYVSGGLTYSRAGSTIEDWYVGGPPCSQPSYVETNGANVAGCSSATPCTMDYLSTDTSTTYPTQTLYTDNGSSFVGADGYTYTKQSAVSDQPYEIQLTTSYPSCATPTYTETSQWGCSPSTPCLMTYVQTRVQSGEITTRYCQYSRVTYTYQATVTSTSCHYQRETVVYAAPGPNTTYCQYSRNAYRFWAPAYTYQWTAVGGEQVAIQVFEDDPASNWCGQPYANGFTGSSPTVCPPNANGRGGLPDAGTGNPCTVGRQCLLKWRTPLSLADGGTAYPNGRISNYTGTQPSRPTLCIAPDSDGGIPQPDPANYQGDWCRGSGTLLTWVVSQDLQGDYYDPTTANPADAGYPMDHKYSGWSRNEDSSHAPAVQFVDIGDNTLPAIQNTLKKYYPASSPTPNPTGLRWAINNSGQDYTPLYGSIKNAGSYMAQQLDADPDYSCRSYYVLLVTDGQEYTPMNYTYTDLTNVVSGLRSSTSPGGRTKDVKTFVVGFGNLAVGGALDYMARAGGTAVNPTTFATDNVNGVSINAADEASLKQTLDFVFSEIVSGYYTRSKPVIATDGSRLYAGYFNKVNNSLEWQGNLDAFAAGSGSVSPPLWKFNNQINAQTSRTIYTKVSTNSGLVSFDTSATSTNSAADQAELYNAMGTDGTTGDAVIKFLINQSKTEPFMDNTRKTSRLSDIYHSNPAIVGKPVRSTLWGGASNPEQAAYQTFKNSYANREITIYVGANDGMLHAIREDPSTTPAAWAGTERWAYVPNQALSILPGMRLGHQFAVDGSMGVEDVCFPSVVGNACVATDWKTVLIGSMRQGASSFYALDVTDPTNPQYLWDFVHGNLGETWSTPTVARTKVSTAGGVVDKWVAFAGGGVSTIPNIGNYIYAIDVQSGALVRDASNTDAVFKVDIGAGPKNNVPARPAIYRPNDSSYAAFVYLGDTQGRVSRMDVRGTSVGSWAPVRFFDPADVSCAPDAFAHTRAPIIRALDGSQVGTLNFGSVTSPPPIYIRPTIGRDSVGRRMVFVGTGDYTNPMTTTDLNYFYAIRDTDMGSSCSGVPVWVKRFEPGEKIVSEPALINGAIVIATYNPPPASGTSCNQAGSGTLYCFDASTGASFNCLLDSLGNSVSRVTIANQGIISDLLTIGQTLVINTSSNPNNPQIVRVGQGSPAKVRSWKRVR